jgi:hypothetical protein
LTGSPFENFGPIYPTLVSRLRGIHTCRAMRDLILRLRIMELRRFLTRFLLLASTCGLTCFSLGQGKVDFKVLRSGNLAIGPERLNLYAIRSETDWKRYWSEVIGSSMVTGSGTHPAPPPSKVDWKKFQLLAIHIGQCPTSGYSLAVTGAVKTKNGFRVDAVEYTPGSAMTLQVLTYPFAIVQLPGHKGKFQLDLVQKRGPALSK